MLIKNEMWFSEIETSIISSTTIIFLQFEGICVKVVAKVQRLYKYLFINYLTMGYWQMFVWGTLSLKNLEKINIKIPSFSIESLTLEKNITKYD